MFTLNEITDTTVGFHVVGHYSQIIPYEDETCDERDARITTSYEYTKAFPIALVLTENGWRFDAFTTAASSKGEYVDDVWIS